MRGFLVALAVILTGCSSYYSPTASYHSGGVMIPYHHVGGLPKSCWDPVENNVIVIVNDLSAVIELFEEGQSRGIIGHGEMATFKVYSLWPAEMAVVAKVTRDGAYVSSLTRVFSLQNYDRLSHVWHITTLPEK